MALAKWKEEYLKKKLAEKAGNFVEELAEKAIDKIAQAVSDGIKKKGDRDSKGRFVRKTSNKDDAKNVDSAS